MRPAHPAHGEASPHDPRSPAARWAVPLLLLAFISAGSISLRLDAITFDETAHLPAGLSYLQRGDFRMNPEHPPLAKIWAALPLVLLGRGSPDYESTAWRGRDDDDGLRTAADEWLFGWSTLNGPPEVASRRDPRDLLVPARLATLAAGVLLVLLVYGWAREAWGGTGGLLALGLACLSPTLLAHSRLVTTDLGAALGYTAALYGAWRFARRPGVARAAALAAAVAFAVATKFTTLLLGPILIALGAAWIASGPRETWRRRAVALGLAGVACMAAAWLALWAVYGFRFAASADPSYRLDWSVVGPTPGAAGALVRGALERHLLPEGYLYGLSYALGGAARRLAFLDGAVSQVGWWRYFPETLLLKTPPALIALVVWAVVWGIRRADRRTLSCLLGPMAIYLAVSIGGHLDIGHRHLLPLYPLAFVLVGGLARAAVGRLARAALVLALIGYAVSFAVATPRYLSYFSELAGGPSRGWRHLLDSNVDWGQDLTRLVRWCAEERVDVIDLAYFGTADPEAWGLRYRKVLLVHDFRPERPAVRPAPGELVAVSANVLQGLYVDSDRELADSLVRRGWLTPTQVRAWLELRDRRTLAGHDAPSLGEWAVEQRLIDGRQRDEAAAPLLSTWLTGLPDEGSPVARVGDSIFIFRAP